jgi:type IV pilus assembly protein PilW
MKRSQVSMSYLKQKGLTLIELMIAIVIGLLIVAAVASLYISSAANFRYDDHYSRLQENGRFAIQILGDDIKMADFWGYSMTPDTVIFPNPASPPTACNVQPYVTQAGVAGGVEMIDAAVLDCLTFTPITGPDSALLIRRVGGPIEEGPGSATIVSGRIFLNVKNLVNLEYVQGDGSSLTLDNGENLWEYRSAAYYISSDNPDTTNPNNVPQLCRVTLNTTSPSEECLIRGVEGIRILWGIDTDRDGRANRLDIAPDPEDLRFAITAKICMLMRSTDEIRNYTNDKSYSLCGDPIDFGSGAGVAPGDGFLRRVIEQTVDVRNSAAMNLFRES